MTNDNFTNTLLNMLNCIEHITEQCNQLIHFETNSGNALQVRNVFSNLSKMTEQYYNHLISKPLISIAIEPPESFADILADIDNNLEYGLTVSQLCKKYHTYPKKLQDQFLCYLGMSIGQYIHEKKVQQAQYYLQSTNLSMQEISIQVGFSSTQNFCRFFKSATNISPLKFRQMKTITKLKDNCEIT